MSKYICIRRNNAQPANPGDAPSPTQMQEMYAKFQAWKTHFASNIVDLGGRLTGVGAVVTANETTDGPYVESKEIVGGYMVLTAENLQEAIDIACQCPGVIGPDGSLEVRELLTM
jgi:hypothetical protein